MPAERTRRRTRSSGGALCEREQNSQRAARSPPPGRTNQRDIPLGERSGMLVLHETGLPFSDIANVVSKIAERPQPFSETSVARIVRDTKNKAAENKENHNPLAVENLASRRRTGRPKKFTKEHEDYIVWLATYNRSQRRKTYAQLAKESKFKISDRTLTAILKRRGYKKCIARRKPRLVPENKKKRLKFAEENDNKPIKGFWDGWIWTDEMSLRVGAHYGPDTVIRNGDEEYIDDCLTEERQGEVTIMFWALIIYGVPCAECPYYVWTVETKEEKAEAEAQMAEL